MDKLPILRDEDDKIQIVLLDALETATSGSGDHIEYTPQEAVTALGGGKSQAGAQSMFDQVASRSDKITYKKEKGNLKVETPGRTKSIADRHNESAN